MAEAAPRRCLDGRSAAFPPAYLKRARPGFDDRPVDRHDTVAVRQGSVFRGIGGKFVQRDADILGSLRANIEVRALQENARAEEVLVVAQLRVDEVHQRDTLPLHAGEQVVRTGKPGEPIAEAADELLGRDALGQRLARHRLDHRQQVLRAMCQLPHQEADMILALLLRRDIANDERCSHDAAGRRADRCAGHPDVEDTPVAAALSRLELVRVPVHDLATVGLALLFRRVGQRQRQRTPRHLRRLGPEQHLRAGVPGGDVAALVDADDGIVRRGDDGRENGIVVLGGLALRDVETQREHPFRLAGGIAEETSACGDPTKRAVAAFDAIFPLEAARGAAVGGVVLDQAGQVLGMDACDQLLGTQLRIRPARLQIEQLDEIGRVNEAVGADDPIKDRESRRLLRELKPILAVAKFRLDGLQAQERPDESQHLLRVDRVDEEGIDGALGSTDPRHGEGRCFFGEARRDLQDEAVGAFLLHVSAKRDGILV